MRIRVCRSKNAGVAGYAEAFRPVQSNSQTSEWYSYFENDVLVDLSVWKSAKSVQKNLKLAALRQWDFSEQRRFPGTKIYTTPANAHQTNKFLSCVLADTGAEWRCADSAENAVKQLPQFWI